MDLDRNHEKASVVKSEGYSYPTVIDVESLQNSYTLGSSGDISIFDLTDPNHECHLQRAIYPSRCWPLRVITPVVTSSNFQLGKNDDYLTQVATKGS